MVILVTWTSHNVIKQSSPSKYAAEMSVLKTQNLKIFESKWSNDTNLINIPKFLVSYLALGR